MYVRMYVRSANLVQIEYQNDEFFIEKLTKFNKLTIYKYQRSSFKFKVQIYI